LIRQTAAALLDARDDEASDPNLWSDCDRPLLALDNDLRMGEEGCCNATERRTDS
jgi:hypothetical protein